MSIPKSPEELQKELDIRMKKFLDKGGKIEKLEPGYPLDVGSFDKSRKPRYTKEEIKNFKPDIIIVFPWNLKNEIMEQLQYTRSWGAKFVIAVPKLEIL